MADPNATGNVAEVSFRFSITNISKLNNEVWSPEYMIDGVPWKVYAHKYVLGAVPTLGLYLYCAKVQSSSNWSHVASAAFELVPFKIGCSPIKFETAPLIFDGSDRAFGYTQFVKWDDLFDAKNSYVKDDTINLQIKIQAKSSNTKVTLESISKCCDDGCLSKFRAIVSHIGSLTAVKTPEVDLQGIPGHLFLSKGSNNLGIRWFFNADCLSLHDKKLSSELRVESISSNVAVKHSEKVQGIIDECSTSLDLCQFISWDKLLEPGNGFIKDDTITIELEIKTKLLQGCHGSSKKRKATKGQQSAAKHLKMSCKICKKDIIDQKVSSLPCGDLFCSPCIIESIKIRKVCPSCGVRATQNGLRRIVLPT